MASTEAKPAKKTVKQRTLELISSLSDEDDERTAISKKLSWILRHGAKTVRCPIDEDGWVKFSDLLKAEIMEDVSEDKLMNVIAESNLQKARYELKNGPDGRVIKAISKEQRKKNPEATKKAAQAGIQQAPIHQVKLSAEANEFVPKNPQASDLPPNPYGGYGWPGYGFGWNPYMANPQANPQAAAMMQQAQAAQAAAMQGRYAGKIRFFNADKGFGFVECPVAHQRYGRDVFLHKADFNGFTVGQDVTFKIETNKEGMPQAREVQAGVVGMAPQDGKGKSKGKDGGKGKEKNGKGKGKGKKSEGKEGKSKAEGSEGKGDKKKNDKKKKDGPVKPGAVEAEHAPPPPKD